MGALVGVLRGQHYHGTGTHTHTQTQSQRPEHAHSASCSTGPMWPKRHDLAMGRVGWMLLGSKGQTAERRKHMFQAMTTFHLLFRPLQKSHRMSSSDREKVLLKPTRENKQYV